MKVLEKILEEIENHAIEFESFGMCDDYVSVGWVKEIIRKHMDDATDTNDGWILVEDGLPEGGEKVLVWYEYFRYGEYNRMFQTHGIGWQYDGHWSGDVSGTKARCIAWRPLPEPYKPKKLQTEEKPVQ